MRLQKKSGKSELIELTKDHDGYPQRVKKILGIIYFLTHTDAN